MSHRPSRAALLRRGVRADRDRPDMDALRAETDPERFVWSVLPHAARSFAASIVVLPGEQARAAAVAYLYCRMLDTYEDLWPNRDERGTQLLAFGERFDTDPPSPTAPIPDVLAGDARDRLHLLLVERIALVDAVFAELTCDRRSAIASLVRDMAAGMAWSAERFAAQGGVLVDRDQLLSYCRHVIGHPAAYAYELVTGRRVLGPARDDAFVVAEMVQLANITRDIEKDLARGVGYHPALRPHLSATGEATASTVAAVRTELVGLALRRAPAYLRLYRDVDLRGRPAARLAAVLLLAFTDLHYRRMAALVGVAPWRGLSGTAAVVMSALPSFVSHRWAWWRIRTVTGRLAAAAASFPAAS